MNGNLAKKHSISMGIISYNDTIINIILYSLNIIFIMWVFTSDLAGGLSLDSDSKSPQVSRIFLSILADLNSAVVRIV